MVIGNIQLEMRALDGIVDRKLKIIKITVDSEFNWVVMNTGQPWITNALHSIPTTYNNIIYLI